MKKYFSLLLVAIFGFMVVSCIDRVNEPVQDNDTYSRMRDVTGSLTATNNYSLNQGIDIPSTDVVLVYRNINSNTTNGVVWQLLPKTFYLDNVRELDYNFLFNNKNVEIYAEANFDQSTMSATEKSKYHNSQTFRIVLVPASSGKNANIDYSDYNAVVKFFNLKEPK